MTLAPDIFVSKFSDLSDEQWLQLLSRSCTEAVVEQVPFPAFPDREYQETFVGASGEGALRDAYVFYRDIKHYATRLGIQITPQTRILDFGCGWGRNYRFFLKDVLPDGLVGIDVDPDCVRLCEEHFRVGRFEVCGVRPPLHFDGESFDIVYAFSVFSHLIENVALAWVEEFSRILKPGGMLIVTSLKEAHLGVWYRKTQTAGDPLREAWPDFNLEQSVRDFQAGKFFFAPHDGLGVRTADFFGEAIIPPKYAREVWAPWLQLIDYVDIDHDPLLRPQALLVAQKPVSKR